MVRLATYLGKKKHILAHRTEATASDTGRNYQMTTQAMTTEKRIGKRKPKHPITRIACWNITSWNGRDQEIIIEMKKHNIDICGISETKKKGQGTSKYGEFTLIYSGKAKQERAHSGVGILLHGKYTQSIEDIEYINDRLLKISIKMGNITTHLISTYALDISKPTAETENFYQQLQNVVDNINAKHKIIVLGDLNARIGNDVIPGIKQKNNEEIINENGEALIDFCSRNELRINNTYFPHKDQHKYTFNNNRGQRSMIDFIITNRTITPSQVLDVRALTSANLGTDHNLVLCKMLLERPQRNRKAPMFIEKYNIESLATESTKLLYENRITSKLKKIDFQPEWGVEDTWQKIKKCINEAAEEAIGKRKINTRATNHTKPWFCQEVKELSELKRKCYLRYKSIQSEEALAEYVQVRNEVNARIKSIKREHWAKFTSDMDYDLYGAQKKVWKMLRNRKKPVNEFVQTKGVPIETWQQHFKKLYDAEETLTINEYETDISGTINDVEVEAKIKKLKNRKSPGTDGIPNELLKYGGPELASKLSQLFNKILKETETPEEWHNSITIPIFKKGQKTCPENYRGITLLNTTMKLFTGVLKDKLERHITNAEEQQGFTKGRSTTDAVFIIKQIKEKAIEFGRPAYICFIDLTKAFDRVRLGDILNMLIETKTPSSITKIIHNLNNNNVTKVRAGDQFTENIPTPGGIRQGDSLSPFLFNLLMGKIINKVTSLNLGYKMGNKRIGMVCYADDAALIADSEDDLQRQLFQFFQISRQLNMNISTNKTKCMTIAKDPLRCKLVVENNPIEQVMQFRYLGIDISSTHDPVKDLRSQINKASALSGCLREIVWSNPYMRTDSKIRIYKTCIRPIMTYGIEVREDTHKTKQMLRVAEMKTLRTIVGKTRRDRVRNTNIREQCKIQDIVRWGRQRKRMWYNHVRRMNENRLPKIALENNPPGSRPPGRPPKRWRDSWQSTSQEINQR